MMATAPAQAPDPWTEIHHPAVSLHLEAETPPDAEWVAALLAEVPFGWRAQGSPESIAAEWQALPADLLSAICEKATRFAALMQVREVSIRLEGIDGNACTKVHADYTDVRLIQTFYGPGTDYAPDGDASAPLRQLPTGWLGLFKGKAYPRASASGHASGHAPCLHRSPPIEGTGLKRLMLVIDTLAKP